MYIYIFCLPSQKCAPFSLIRFICFLLCYFNWVIVNPASPLAMFFPRAWYEVLDLPRVWASVVSAEQADNRNAVFTCRAGCPSHNSKWSHADTHLAAGMSILGVEIVSCPSLSKAREPRGGSEKRACLGSCMVVWVTGEGVRWGSSLLAPQ